MKAIINVKDEYVYNQIENLTTTYSPWIFEYEKKGEAFVFRYEDENNKQRTKVVVKKHLVKGLSVMAKEAPSRLGNVVTGDSDAIDADVFVQCVIFGKLVYA